MAYQIKKAAVLGSGVMGSGIAAHLANIGIPVLLLDIVPTKLDGTGRSKGSYACEIDKSATNLRQLLWKNY